MGVGAADRGLQTACRADVRHRLRGIGGGRRALRFGGLRRVGAVPAGGSHHPRQQARQFLGDGRDGSLRPLFGDSFRPARRGGDRCSSGARNGQHGPSSGDRDLEPRLHAVQPQGQRHARTAAGEERRYGYGLRASVHDYAGQEVELRYRCVPAYDRPSGRAVGQELRGGRQVRRGHARGGRPSARHRLLDRRRPAAVECQGGVCHPPHPAPRRALRLHLFRFHRALHLQAGGGTGGADGRPVPRTAGAADAHRACDRGGGEFVPADAGHGYHTARRRDRRGQETGRIQDFGARRLRAL